MANGNLPPALPTTRPSSLGASALQLAAVATPSVILMNLMMQPELPAWVQKMADDWGPIVFLFGVIGALMFRYIPRDALQQHLATQRAMAITSAMIAQSLRGLEGQGGHLDKLKDQVAVVITNQATIITTLQEVEGDLQEQRIFIEGRHELFRHIEALLATIAATIRDPLAPKGEGGGEKTK